MYTEQELSAKYSNIESKIPGVWKSEMMAALNLQQDLTSLGHTIKDDELCRVVGLLHKFNPSFFNKVITDGFEFKVLYPNVQKKYDVNALDEKLRKLTDL